LIPFLTVAVSLVSLGCATTDSAANQSDSSGKQGREVRRASKRDENRSSGNRQDVVVTLSNGPSFQGSVPTPVLLDIVVAMEELVQKNPNDLGVLVTYLGLLRLQGQGGQIYDSMVQRAGAIGASDPWFLIEASYGALVRKDFGQAEFFLAKAEKQAKVNAQATAAIKHAFGVSNLMQGRVQQAVADMKQAASGSSPHLPALLTLGFMGLQFGDYVGAERAFRQGMALSETNSNARMGLAIALRVRGKANEALGIIRALHDESRSDRRVVWNYALTLGDLPGKEKEAIALLERYFQLPGTLPDIDSKATQLLNTLQARVQSNAKT
jgi:tetratricopeptide (TPR) repeat protein